MSKNRKYTGDFKIKIIEVIKNNKLTCSEVLKKYNIYSHLIIMKWERIYLEERKDRVKSSNRILKGRPIKLSKEVEDDLIKENQTLRMENKYLKKLDILIQSRNK